MSWGIIFIHPWDYLKIKYPPRQGSGGICFQIVPRVNKNDTPPPLRGVTDSIFGVVGRRLENRLETRRLPSRYRSHPKKEKVMVFSLFTTGLGAMGR